MRYPGQHPPLIDGATWYAVQAQLATNHHENRTRTNAKSKSLLAGLVYDGAGNRLVCSHATKNGKRYRYYVTPEANGRSVAAAASVPKLRLAATMIDELLRVRLQSFLTDKAQISNLLRETRCRPAEIGSGLGIASRLANSLTSAAPIAQNVAELLARVTVNPTSINISIKRDRLLAMLTDTFTEPSQDSGQDNIISLEAVVPTAPGGASDKLVFEDQNGKTPDAVVVKAIARASVWFEHLTAGKSQSMAQIAVREDITDNYVSNLIHLAWLSPDIVDRVLEGDPAATALARGAMLTRKSEALWKGTSPKRSARCRASLIHCYGSGAGSEEEETISTAVSVTAGGFDTRAEITPYVLGSSGRGEVRHYT